MTNKVCSKCKELRSFSEFYSDKRATDGLQSSCVHCNKKEGLKRRSFKNVKAKKAAYDRVYNEINKERRREKSKAYRDKNKEKISQRVKRWREENPEKVVEQRHKRVRRVEKASPPWLNEEQKLEIRAIYKRARETGLTVDHVIPLKAKNACGLHVPWNLALMTKEENDEKGNSFDGGWKND